MNRIDSVNNEIYILGEFNINLYLNDCYLWQKECKQVTFKKF